MVGTKKPKPHLHLVEVGRKARTPTTTSGAAAYTNRFGDTYYLHQGTTKTGKQRYFVARAVGAGAQSALPEGYELTESINGVVSVKRSGGPLSLVPHADVDTVRRELARHPRLQHYAVDVRKDEIFVYEPEGLLAENDLEGLARTFGMPVEAMKRRLEERPSRTRYAPVMKFVFVFVGASGEYLAHRRHHHGEGGWWVQSQGPLLELLQKYFPHLGTERFFEMM